jgi:hypothetical protein
VRDVYTACIHIVTKKKKTKIKNLNNKKIKQGKEKKQTNKQINKQRHIIN